jgi:hypothetical protein
MSSKIFSLRPLKRADKTRKMEMGSGAYRFPIDRSKARHVTGDRCRGLARAVCVTMLINKQKRRVGTGVGAMSDHIDDFGDNEDAGKGSRSGSVSAVSGNDKKALDSAIDASENMSTELGLFRTFLKQLPYIVMLGLALVGVGIVSFTGRALDVYWFILAPAYGVMCVVAGWPRVQGREERFRLIWKQVLHWATFLVAMLVVTSSEVRGVENNNSMGLNLMTILASGTFVAGVHAEAWQVCVVGALLALAVPGVAWIEQSALLVVLLTVLAVFVIGSLIWAAHMQRRIAESG